MINNVPAPREIKRKFLGIIKPDESLCLHMYTNKADVMIKPKFNLKDLKIFNHFRR